jgi:anti-sigma28 factor (negative regulator of flagellin synthesis)
MRETGASHFIGPIKEDPTKNVRDVLAATVQRHDDLREADNRYYDLALASNKEISSMGRQHLDQMAELRAAYQREIRASDLAVAAQTRQVDVLAGNASAQSLATAVVALQATTDRNAETLRSTVSESSTTLAKQVTDTATAQQLQTNAANAAMEARVAAIEKSINQGAGRQSVEDPQMTRLIKNMEAMLTAQAMGGGEAKGKDDSWKLTVGVVGILGMIAGLGFTIYATTHTTNPVVVAAPAAVTPPAPQVIYIQPMPSTALPPK